MAKYDIISAKMSVKGSNQSSYEISVSAVIEDGDIIETEFENLVQVMFDEAKRSSNTLNLQRVDQNASKPLS